MPIFDRMSAKGAAVVAAFGVLALSGCDANGEFAGRSAFGHGPVTALRVAQNSVTVVGPSGYCIDKSGSRDRERGSFVLLGSCATLNGEPEGPTAPGVLTALVSPETDQPQAPTAAQLERFLRSTSGRAALSHDNRADTVTLLDIRRDGDVLLLKVRDRSTGRPDDLQDTSWRAVLAMKNRLVALSVHSHEAVPMTDAQMRRTLDRFLAAMRAANAAPVSDQDA
ncbi:hypothetical protein [Fluviibacterium sp. S390]|uniref:hypothetical protein n=1 Tax=Fluviibacterium sp. S390 TaxID=3415139 RepID=UPI003C79DB5A